MKKFLLIKTIAISFAFALFFTPNNALAQKKKKKKTSKTETVKKKDNGFKKIADVTKKCKKIDGLFPIYQDTTNGSIKMVINENQLNKEYIYFSQLSDGVVEAGSYRGMYKRSKVFKIEKFFNKIELVTQNTSFYFNPKNAISKSSNANTSRGIMASLEIEAVDQEKGLYLINANLLFLKETFTQIKPAAYPGRSARSFSLGALDKGKTKIIGIRNYPENTDLAVEYAYSKVSTLNGGSNAVSDGRNVSIKVYHSLIKMPENDYTPLIDDPRVGYFITKVTDMTSTSATPYRDLVHRWDLKKKDPNAKLSEPIEPIVWWMENTTPEELRPIIKAAGEKWNLAFEKAGFKNAIVIKQQPDDADWDAGDIRYNVLRWTSSPRPPFGGFGPSFVNPRTGQILGADIMLEFISLTNKLRTGNVFKNAALELTEEENNLPEYLNNNPLFCNAGELAHLSNLFGKMTLQVLDNSKADDRKLTNEFLHFLILHEMGHTLGLNHNMKSSQLHNIKDIHNESITSKVGLTGSVMDYPSINIAKDREKQGQYFTTRPGPYDAWAIQFAYQPRKSQEETDSLLALSTLPELAFGNDADDMRRPGKAIDPRVNVNDLTSDAIEYAVERIQLSKEVAKSILEKNKKNNVGESHQIIRNSYLILMKEHAGAANTISRYIGGVYVDRAMIGQQGGTKPFTPVEYEKQKMAMSSLSKYVFASNAFDAPNNLYNYLQTQRRGFNLSSNPEDPKIHTRILTIQKSVLQHILHYNTLQRITDSELYGNKYTLSAVMIDLNNAIFKDDIAGNINTFRQHLQLAYTEMLINMVTGPSHKKYLSSARSMALYNLKSIKKMATNTGGDILSKAHKDHLITLINNTLKEIK